MIYTEVNEFLINERILEYNWITQKIPDRKSILLDVGASNGQILELYPNAIGFDWELDKKYPHRITQGDIINLSSRIGFKFFLITCISTLEHIGCGHYGDPKYSQEILDIAFRQLLEVLKTKGSLLITIPLETSVPLFYWYIKRDFIPLECIATGVNLVEESLFRLNNTTGTVKLLGCYHIKKSE